MSEAIIRGISRAAVRDERDGLAVLLNRAALVVTVRIEAALERRRERRLIGAMSDRELADIGIGRSEVDHAFRDGR